MMGSDLDYSRRVTSRFAHSHISEGFLVNIVPSGISNALDVFRAATNYRLGRNNNTDSVQWTGDVIM